MRSALLVAGAAWLAATSTAYAQQTPRFVSGFADQSWMVNGGNRGDGPIDHGTLAGVAATSSSLPSTGSA